MAERGGLQCQSCTIGVEGPLELLGIIAAKCRDLIYGFWFLCGKPYSIRPVNKFHMSCLTSTNLSCSTIKLVLTHCLRATRQPKRSMTLINITLKLYTLSSDILQLLVETEMQILEKIARRMTPDYNKIVYCSSWDGPECWACTTLAMLAYCGVNDVRQICL